MTMGFECFTIRVIQKSNHSESLIFNNLEFKSKG
nr:MAG TPA_asm: hypothetical protein [Caudoviricetes sp.]